MIEQQKTNWAEKGGHPPEDELSLYADGELEAPAVALCKAHLEACWSCRVKLAEVQETIADFIGYRNQVLRRLVPPPPGHWRGLAARLAQVSAGAESRPWWAQFVSRLSGSFAELRAGAPLLIRGAVGLLLTLGLALAWFCLRRAPVVTAAELLERATAAQTQKILATSQPVIHQQIQVKRKRGARTPPESAQWEAWHDLNNARFKQPGGAASSLLSELAQVCQTNRLDWRRPLSAVSFAAWRAALRGKNEELRRARLAEGLEVLNLNIVSTEPPRTGAIRAATLTVRARDWHPFRQVLRVSEAAGEAEYELTETAFEVVSLATVNPAVFAESPAVKLAAATPLPAPSVAGSPLPASLPTPVMADRGLEIEALALLAQAKADLGEQVDVERTPEGTLKITGLVETLERKQALKRALAPVLASPAVRLELETVEEALRRTKPAAVSPPAVVEQRTTASSRLPVEEELRRYLSGQGRLTAAQLDGEVQRLARRTVNASFSLRQHAQALKRVAERFTPEQWQAFDEAARVRLLDLIAAHTAAVRAQGQALRQSLQSIFNSSDSPPATSSVAEIASVAELIRAIHQLVELSATSDRAIQAAFTLSTEGAPAQAIKMPAFWRALANLEQVAGELQTGVARLRKQ